MNWVRAWAKVHSGSPVVLCLALGVAGCGSSPPGPGSAGSDPGERRAIDDVTIRFLIASNVGDAEAVSQLFTDDAVFLQSTKPAIRGNEALRSWFREAFETCSFDGEAFGEETVVTDRWAFNWGTYVTTVTPKAGGESAMVKGHFLNVFRREPDGSWKIARHIRDREDAPPASCL